MTPSTHTPRLSGPLMLLAKVVAISVFLTSSFDIFLVIEAGGNYRFCQIIAPVLVVLAIIKVAWGRIVPILGAFPLAVWLAFQIAFIPVTSFWQKPAAYTLWLALDLGLVFSFVQLFSNELRSLTAILRWYVYSFALMAAFGVIQFTLPLLGMPAPLVTQWWIRDVLPRANGFSYEPSYFATYLLIGFVFVGSLRRGRSSLLPRTTLLIVYLLTALGILVSSSRVGVAFLLLDVFLSQLQPFASFLADLRTFRISLLKAAALIPSLLCIGVICALGAAASSLIEKNPAIALLLLNGTGISDTAAHSVVQRENALQETVTVFLKHPLVGRSLGGVSVAIADLEGKKVNSFEASKDFEGMSVFAEALAGSGVIGIVPFVWFLITTVRRPLKLARITPASYSVLLRALVRSLLFAWAILQFNQNMLRPYLWTHLAILATVYAAASPRSARCIHRLDIFLA